MPENTIKTQSDLMGEMPTRYAMLEAYQTIRHLRDALSQREPIKAWPWAQKIMQEGMVRI